jgi:hypothetical protein
MTSPCQLPIRFPALLAGPRGHQATAAPA